MTESSQGVRAAQYVRMSTDMQDCSIAYQMNHNAAFASERGYTLVRTFADEGVSGLGIERREALQALVAEATSGAADFSVVLVFDVSRWGRFQNPDEAAYYEFVCARSGVAIEYTAEPGLNDGTLTATLVKAIKRVMAADYSRELSLRLAAAKRALTMRGHWISGPAPFGYVRQLVNARGELGPCLRYGQRMVMHGFHAVLRPEPAEAETVRRVFRLYGRGWTCANIAARLDAEGLTYRPGIPWNWSVVAYMLRNELYTGVMVHGRARTFLGTVRTIPKAQHIRIEGFAEPLVTRALFNRAQRERANRRRRWTRDALLDGLRRTLAREGRLSVAVITRSPDCPSVDLYSKAFGPLEAAYDLVGFRIPERQRVSVQHMQALNHSRPEAPNDAVLIGELREALARYGELSAAIIKRAPELRSTYQYRKRLGGLGRAYALAGYKPTRRQVVGVAHHPWLGQAPAVTRPRGGARRP